MERPLSRNFSSLSIGSARFQRKPRGETTELKLDKEEYRNLVSSRSSRKNFFPSIEDSKMLPKSPREQVELPKTYITRNGPLVLYADSKAIRDGARDDAFPFTTVDVLSIKGNSIQPVKRQINSRRRIKRKAPSAGQRRPAYKGVGSTVDHSNSRGVVHYNTNQGTVHYDTPQSPLPLTRGLTSYHTTCHYPSPATRGLSFYDNRFPSQAAYGSETVRGFQEAVLSYGQGDKETDKYYRAIQETWKDRTRLDEPLTDRGVNKGYSSWTVDWILSHQELVNSPMFKRDKTMILDKEYTVHHFDVDGYEKQRSMQNNLAPGLHNTST